MWNPSKHQSNRTLRRFCSELELQLLERTAALQSLSQRLLRVQDEERRRVARDLHDSTGQTLTALKISIALLRRKLHANEGARDDLSTIEILADQALQEIRTTSYLLHPPLLDEAGFTCAAQWFVEGFSRRSGMTVVIDLDPDLIRLPKTIEIALFRVLQESLTNAHRHSGTKKVSVRLRREVQAVVLEVRDFGRGMPQLLTVSGPSTPDSGVGLAGMRERLNELRGRLEIQAASPGTVLRATVPLSALAASASSV
jgi:two-component system NarL family sensor kinase